jgi:CBS domain-containing protein
MLCPCCDRINLPGADWCENCNTDLTEQDRPVPQDRVHSSLLSDPVAALSPRPACTVPMTASVDEAVRLMAQHDIGAVLVLDEAGQLAGIFTERDLLLKVELEKEGARARAVAEFMTRRPASVRESDSLAFAMHLLDCGGYRHLPVLREGQLVGMISVRDVLRHITRMCNKVQGPG